MSHYLLSCQQQHSTNDIKSVICCPPNDVSAGCPRLITASRDLTVKAWMVGAKAMTRFNSALSQDDQQQQQQQESSSPVGVEGEVNTLIEFNTMVGHTDYLQSVAQFGEVIVSGGNDKTIRVWSGTTGSNIAVMVGHDASAKTLAFFSAADGRTMLCSGGWDHKCCIWDLFGSRRLVLDCYLHTQPVLCVIAFKSKNMHHDLLLSCSGDKRVVLWDPSNYGKALMEFIGHNDTVQTLVQIDDTRFASGGNDGDILLWDVPSDAVGYIATKTVRIPTFRINAHEAFIYTLAWDPAEQALISGGEDKTIRIWDGVATAGRNGNEAPPRSRQMILQPCLIWSICVVAGAGKGPTFAACGADGFVRLWTTNRDMVAAPETMDAFQAACAAGGGSGADRSNVPDASTLPTIEELNARGPPEREGQQQFVRGTAGEVEMYRGQNGHWVHLGTVVADPDGGAGAGSGAAAGGGGGGAAVGARGRDQPPRKGQFFKGQAYDYLFPISAGDQQLSLPYNAGDSVYDAAQNFINDYSASHGISQGDKQEIINHIVSQLHHADRDLLVRPAHNNNNSNNNRNDDDAGTTNVSQTGRNVGSGPLMRVTFDETERSPALIKQKLVEWDVLPNLETVSGHIDQLATSGASADHLLSRDVGLFGRLKDEQLMPFFDIVRIVSAKHPERIKEEIVDLCIAGAVGPSRIKADADAAAATAAGGGAAAAAAAAAQSSCSGASSSSSSSVLSAARGRERVMALRALANMVMLCPGNVLDRILCHHSKIIIDIRRHFLGPDSTPVSRAAAGAFFTNCSIRLGHQAELTDAEAARIPELLSAVGAWMTWERDEETIGSLLRIAANLMLHSPNELTRAVAASGSSDSIGPEVKRLLALWPANETLKRLDSALA